MFNKNIQTITKEIYKEVLLLEIPNSVKGNRECELWLLITPSKNYYKVIPYNNNQDKVFSDEIKAKAYLKKVSR